MWPIALLWGPLVVVVVLVYMAAIGLLFSPVAALATHLAARRKGLHSRRYVIAGALYSALLILPWLMLMMNLVTRNRRSTSTLAICLPLVAVYSVWLFGPILLIIVALSIETSIFGEEPASALFVGVAVGQLIVMGLAWITSLLMIVNVNTEHGPRPDGLIQHKYVAPFTGTLLSVLLLYIELELGLAG